MLERIIEAKDNIEYVINESITRFDSAVKGIMDYVNSFNNNWSYSINRTNNNISELSYSTYPLSAAVMTWDGNRQYSGDDITEITARDMELNNVYSEFEDYAINLSPSLVEYLESKGKKLVDIVGIASADIGDGVVAAIQRTNKEGLLIANKDYASTITAFAYAHGLTYDEAKQFVWDHELIHGANVDAEIDVFKTQLNYYSIMAETSESEENRASYMRLAKAAHARYAREENGKKEVN